MDSDFWNHRYSTSEFIFGTEPNQFLADHAAKIPPGPVLSLAEGEGRNAVFLAGLGHPVTAVDSSSVGIEKLHKLARDRGVVVETILADLRDFKIQPGRWAGIISIWVHLPLPLRHTVHRRCVEALIPGGVFILEGYTPDQLRHGTGGPKAIELLMTLRALKSELDGLEFVVARETERKIEEGLGHSGLSATVQIVGRKPTD